MLKHGSIAGSPGELTRRRLITVDEVYTPITLSCADAIITVAASNITST